jgi:branched-chain amino acid transport system substrate-binding protein
MRSRIVMNSRLIAAQLLMALLLTSCAGGPTGPTQAEKEAAAARFASETAAAKAAAEEAGRIHIGVAGPMTGDFEVYGNDMRRGAELAVADINAAGGVLGRELVLEVADDHCGIEDADAAARELVSRGVVFVDGHFCSGSSIRGSKVYAGADVLQITPSSTNTLLTDTAHREKVTTLLRVVGRDDMQGDFAAEWLAAAYADQPIAIVSDNGLYGKGIAARLLAKLKEKGIRPIIDGQFTQGQTSYATLVEALKKSGARVLYVAAYHDDIGRIAWALRVAKLDIELVGPDVLNNPEFWSFSQTKGNGALQRFRPGHRTAGSCRTGRALPRPGRRAHELHVERLCRGPGLRCRRRGHQGHRRQGDRRLSPGEKREDGPGRAQLGREGRPQGRQLYLVCLAGWADHAQIARLAAANGIVCGWRGPRPSYMVVPPELATPGGFGHLAYWAVEIPGTWLKKSQSPATMAGLT